MNGDDFSRPTIDLLAKRAAYTCSNPGCGARTIGPSRSDPTKTVSVGVAAHITASRLKGARHDQSLSSEARRSAENGIWLCQSCSRKIDVNDGADYSVDTLKEWKANHEQEVADAIGRGARVEHYELDGFIEARGIGNVIAADLRAPTRIRPGTHASASGIGNITGVRIGGKNE